MLKVNPPTIKPMLQLLNIFHILILSYASIVPFLDIVARRILYYFSIRLLIHQYLSKPAPYCAYCARKLYWGNFIILQFRKFKRSEQIDLGNSWQLFSQGPHNSSKFEQKYQLAHLFVLFPKNVTNSKKFYHQFSNLRLNITYIWNNNKGSLFRY